MKFYSLFIALALVLRTYGNSLIGLSSTFVEPNQPVSNNTNSSTSDTDHQRHCARVILDSNNVNFLLNGNMFVPSFNVTIHPSKMHIIQNNRKICFHATDQLRKDIFKHCSPFLYNPDEFKQFPNGTITLLNILLGDELYEITKEGKLKMCSMDYDDLGDDEFVNLLPKPMDDTDKASMYIGNIGSAISIFALIAHIVIFCMVPSLRNLPGYNLASLSLAFLMAYSSSLIGQIPEVLGAFCIISAISQQYFFLVAFFWMNVMAFDVWKTLRMATERLMVSTKTARRRQFLWYSSYAWFVPLFIVAVTVGVDNSKNVSPTIKPLFGKNSLCWFTNYVAKAIFFSLPAFVLFLINVIFFILSAFILKNNTMKQSSECEHHQTAKFNFILYVRLALLMGVTWLIGVIGIILSNSGIVWSETVRIDTVVWFFFDILNSLQGLFVFLLFSCSRKVFRHLHDRMSMSTIKTDSDKHILGESTKCNRESSKWDFK